MSFQNPSLGKIVSETQWRAEHLAGLLGRLRAKVAALEAGGKTILCITAGESELVRLFEEGGDDVVTPDPDPASDRAWFGKYELKPSGLIPGVRIHVQDEVEGVCRYSV